MANTNKFTSARKSAILKLIKNSTPITTACEKVGIDRTTFYKWQDKARIYNPDDKDTKSLKPYFVFFEKIAQAKAESLIQLISDIYETGKGYEAKKIVEEYEVTEIENEDGKKEEVISNRKIKKTTQFIRHPQSLTFLAERLFPALLGNRLKIDGDLVDQLIVRELVRLAGSQQSRNIEGTATKSIQESGKELAEPGAANEPEDWETLPTEQ